MGVLPFIEPCRILGLFEEPGTVWSYSNQWYFRPLRDALGLF